MGSVYRDEGCALKAERIACQARKVISRPVRHASSTHKIQSVTLVKNAYCVIEKPFRETK